MLKQAGQGFPNILVPKPAIRPQLRFHFTVLYFGDIIARQLRQMNSAVTELTNPNELKEKLIVDVLIGEVVDFCRRSVTATFA